MKEKQPATASEYNDSLTLENICGGSVPERFQRELSALLQNINDPNNPAETKRKLTLEFEFEPFPDRTGAIVTLICKSKLAATENVQGGIYFSRSGLSLRAHAHDPRQVAMFTSQTEREVQ